MWKLIQVSLRRAAGTGVRLPGPRFPGPRLPAPEAPGAPGAPGRPAPGSCRLLSTRTRASRSCTVDPNLEEQFVFLDCSDEQEGKDPVLQQNPDQQQNPVLQQNPDQVSPGKQLRSLERQLQALGGQQVLGGQDSAPDYIQFEDVDFPLDPGLVASQRKRRKVKKGEHRIFGTPDVSEQVSETCCSGCGAVLHCADVSLPGYLPSEKFKVLRAEQGLGGSTCQRCYLLTHHQRALQLQLPADQYRAVLRQVRPLKALVLLIVDLLDLPDSIVADLPELVGANKRVVVLGNKADLLPADSPNYLQRIRRRLTEYCRAAGFGEQLSDVQLISAKTGYGIEVLVSSLQRSWKHKGDVYLVGNANAGKSTLFNTLLLSDFCKTKSPDVISKATISPWPGTTLNLLKFPIMNPTPQRMMRRQQRLDEASQQTEEELQPEELKRLQQLSRGGYLVGRVGRTFQSESSIRSDEIEFDVDRLSFGADEDGDTRTPSAPSRSPVEFTYNELKDAHWLFDTPGIMKEHDLLSLLTEQEVKSVVPTQAIVPRTFVLKPGTSLLVGAVARIDYLQGEKSCWFSVVASSRVPVHVTSSEKADAVYEKHAGGDLLGVPLGGSDRMKDFPPLLPQEFKLEGRGHLEAAADITLSSAGWVAVTGVEGDQLVLRVLGPQAAGYRLRTPALLPHIVSLKGQRVPKSAAYKTVKPAGRLEDGLSPDGAERLQVKKKKKKKK
ncbi:nitric oxide-associated protein 1 [Scomber japonicus]|uniref:nitric oxide-associated protein 1 n=1 Tax=Scomber japonicus TaxID=13676 RepID=UPI002305F469|nr:nitric oxide-associated protein 1 [Scomber japonicus]